MRTKSSRNSLVESESHRDRWMISYADLVTLLLALFVVMFAASDRERARVIAEGFAGQTTSGNGILPYETASNDDTTEKRLLENPVLAEKTKIRQTDRGVIISLTEAGFFATGDAAVGGETDKVVKKIAEDLKNETAQIRVEGHTDSTPISTPKFSSNWELSTARAANILQKLIENGIAPERLAASGYGGFQPVADNSTPEGRAQNRRVDIVILNR